MSTNNEGNGQFSMLGKMVLQKLEELRQLDARIEKRLEHLNHTDQNLRVLFDSLRTAILEAHPIIGQMNDLRQGGATVVREVYHALANVRQSAGEAIDAMQTKLEEKQLLLAESTAREGPAVDSSSIDWTQLGRTQLDEAVAEFTAQADSTVAAVRRSVAQQVEQLAAQAKLDIRPVLSKLDEQKDAAEAQLAAAAETAEMTLMRRADELKRNAERMIELCEQQLVDRITNIRPRTRAAVEAIEQAANQRLTQTMDDMQKAIGRAEQLAVERVESIRPRYAEMMLQLENDILEQSKRMEDDAVAGAHWLEHRLASRVNEMSAKVNRALRGEIDQLDQHIDANPGQRLRPHSPVQVQVMAGKHRRNDESESASAA